MKIRIILSALLISFFILYGYLTIINLYYRTTPEENIRLYFLEQIKQNGLIIPQVQDNENKKYNTNLILPRNTVVSPDKTKLVPADFIGYYSHFSIPYIILNTNSFWIIVIPFFSILGIYSIYRIGEILINPKVGLISAFLVGIFPPYAYLAFRLMTDIPSLAMIFFGLSYLLQGIKEKDYQIKYAIISGIAISIGLTIRYTNFILVILFILFFTDFKNIINKKMIKYFIIFAFTSVLIFATVLISNHFSYGHPLRTGQTISSPTDSAIGIRTREINLFHHIYKFYVDFFGIITILSLVNLFDFIKSKKKSSSARKFVYISILLIPANVLMFGNSDVFGSLYKNALLNHTLVRYYLGIYSLLIISTVILLQQYKRMAFIFIPLSLYFILNLASYKGTGLINYYYEVQQTKALQAFLLENTKEDSYIFARIYDRILFPERKIISYYNAGLDPINLRIKNATYLIAQLKQDKKTVYFLKEDVGHIISKERNYESYDEYNAVLDNLGLRFVKLKGPINEIIKK